MTENGNQKNLLKLALKNSWSPLELMCTVHTVAIWTTTFKKKKFEVILKANFKPAYRPNLRTFQSENSYLLYWFSFYFLQELSNPMGFAHYKRTYFRRIIAFWNQCVPWLWRCRPHCCWWRWRLPCHRRQPPLGDGGAVAVGGGRGVAVVVVVEARRWEERHWG